MIGVSTGTAESHERFVRDEALAFRLDAQGIVRGVWEVDDVVSHLDEVLEPATSLKARSA